MNLIVRRTLIGFLTGAVAFGAGSLYQAVSSGVGLGPHPRSAGIHDDPGRHHRRACRTAGG